MILRRYCLLILFSLLGAVTYAQDIEIYGPTTVRKGQKATYNAILHSTVANPIICFEANGGSMAYPSTGCNEPGLEDFCTKCNSVDVTWNSSGTSGTVRASYGTTTATLNVILVTPLVLSDITPKTQDVKYNTAGTAFTMASPTGGNGTYTYVWQRQNDNLDWETVSGATSISFTPPAATRNTNYRVAVTSYDATVYSKPVAVTVHKQFAAGDIYGYQRVAANATPNTIKGEPAVGDSGKFSYQWQQSSDKSTWTDIANATSLDYTPAAATTTKYYRRKVVSAFATTTATLYSNISAVAIAGTGDNNTPAAVTTGYTQPLQTQPDIPGTLTSFNSTFKIEYDILKANVKDAAGVAALTTKETGISKTWQDGLGREIQSISVQATSRNKDVIHQVNYDDLGRIRQHYLPYIDSTQIGQLRTTAGTRQQTFYKNVFPQENFFYSKSAADGAGNTLISTIPGNSWAGSNTGSSNITRALNSGEQVWRWVMVDDNTPALAAGTDRFYDAGEIEVTELIDVYGRKNIKYRDRQGQLLLDISQNGASWLYQYYVYDGYGRLAQEISPKAVKWIQDNYSTIPTATVWNLDNDVRKNLCTGYRYDYLNRCIARKDPGTEESVVVYDKKRRPILTQTGIQRESGQWSYLVYDLKGHIIISGIYKNTATRDQLQTQVDQATPGIVAIALTEPGAVDLVLNQYTGKSLYEAKNSISLTTGFETVDGAEIEFNINTNLPDVVTLSQIIADQDVLGLTTSANATPLNYNYYDNYDFPGAGGKAYNTASISKLKGGSDAVTPERVLIPIGFITGSRIKVFYPTGVTGPEWLTTVNYYDRSGKIIQTQADNILGGTDIQSTAYSYSGKAMSTHTSHYNPFGIPNKQYDVVKRYSYYDNGQLLQSWMTINNNPEQLMETNYYNDFGQVNKKILGNGIETLDYTYDINGMLKGINADYAENKTGNHYFGTSIHHNEGYSNITLDGTVSGITWRRKGDADAAMSYGYQYDNVKRLSQAYFTQNKGSGWSQEKDYSVDNLKYDENGNTLTMRSKSTYLGMTKAVDDLTYTYQANTNKLIKVKDIAGDNQQQDFKELSNGDADDYSYNTNGALTADANKNIQLEWNNIIEKPTSITFDGNTNKTISYVYDASGYRWQKIVKDGTNTDVYTYNGPFLYKNDSTLIQYTNETGRVRWAKLANSGVYTYANDYFLYDHLGNIRTVITEQKDTAVYVSTFETARDAVENALFSNRDETIDNIPTTYSFYNSSTNKLWSKLNGSDPSKRVGTSIVLKVMAGDVIDVAAKAYYKQMEASNSGAVANEMISALMNAMLGSSTAVIDNGHGNLVQGNNTILNTSAMNTFLNQTQQDNNIPVNYPKAYINYVLFDEDFNMVSGNVLRVNKGSDALLNYAGSLEIPKNGFLYVYESNESPVDVWFDDLAVSHRSGPLLQENTLYPYGLNIAAQSSRALMKAANEYVYQGKELDEENSLNYNYFDYRYYDPQLGRFISIDPGRQFTANGYSGMGNNPAMFVDPDGRFVWVIIGIGAAMGAFSGYSIAKAKHAQGFWEWFGYIGGGAVIGGASAYAGSAVGIAAGLSITNATGVVAHAGLYAAILGGTTGGAISGLGFGILSGSDNLLKTTAISALSGAVGGAVGTSIAGGGGAFVGGFASSITNSSLTGGGDFGSILTSGLASGTMAWGAYQINAAFDYKIAKQAFKKEANWNLSRKQFNVMSRLNQRSLVNGKEYGGWLNEDGSIYASKSNVYDKYLDGTPAGGNGSISWHTHPNLSPPNTDPDKAYAVGHSDRIIHLPGEGDIRVGDMATDFKDILHPDHQYSSIVIGRTQIYYHDVTNFEFPYLSDPFLRIRYFNPFPYNTFLKF